MTGDALSVKEVAKKTALSISTVHRMIRDEGMPHVRFGSRIIIYSDQLDLWIKQRTYNRIEESVTE